MDSSKKKRYLLLALFFIVGTVLGGVGSSILSGDCPECIAWEPPDCPDCPIYPECPEPEKESWWTEEPPAPCPEPAIETRWLKPDRCSPVDCSPVPCVEPKCPPPYYLSDCHAYASKLEKIAAGLRDDLEACQGMILTPSVLIGLEEDLSEVVCYLESPEGLIEVASLELKSCQGYQLEFGWSPTDKEFYGEVAAPSHGVPPPWSLRLGLAEGGAVDLGLSRSFSRHLGGFADVRWDHDPDKILQCRTREYDKSSLCIPAGHYQQDETQLAVGLEIKF